MEVPPPAIAAATARGVHVFGGSEAVVRRAIAAAATAVPVQAVAEAVTVAVAVGARVVELAQVILLVVKDAHARASHDLEEAVAFGIERAPRLRQADVAVEVVVEDLDPL